METLPAGPKLCMTTGGLAVGFETAGRPIAMIDPAYSHELDVAFAKGG